MRFSSEQVVWQEVPGEVSLAYTISGCQLRCPGCHSADTWPLTAGTLITLDYLQRKLEQYHGLITCVVFLGGEWHEQELLSYLQLAQQRGLKTCLYTGLEDVSTELKAALTYLKVGPWLRELGGLDSPTTNQRFIEVSTNTCLNTRFLTEPKNPA